MDARHREEVEFTLTAVVNAIAVGKLPPDDARAWARIAAYEARALIEPAVWTAPNVQIVTASEVSIAN